MATDTEQHDDGEEAQVTWLLESGHDTPEMPREFVDRLSQRLDAEFALTHANGYHAAGAAPSTNGSSYSAVDAENHVEVAPEKEAASSTKRAARPRRRWVLSMIAAASVALAVAIVSNPPAWAAAVRAIVQRIEALATGGVADEADVANVVEGQPQVHPRKISRAWRVREITKQQTIVRPEPSEKVAVPAVPAPVVQKADNNLFKSPRHRIRR